MTAPRLLTASILERAGFEPWHAFTLSQRLHKAARRMQVPHDDKVAESNARLIFALRESLAQHGASLEVWPNPRTPLVVLFADGLQHALKG